MLTKFPSFTTEYVYGLPQPSEVNDVQMNDAVL